MQKKEVKMALFLCETPCSLFSAVKIEFELIPTVESVLYVHSENENRLAEFYTNCLPDGEKPKKRYRYY